MTLGRLFDPVDRGLLMAVALGPDGHPAAFCQFVPAPAIDGYTLDQIRHTTRALPPGIVDLLVVETILHLGEGGIRNVGLNFSVASRRMAHSDADGLGGRAQRWLLDHLSRTGQSEGLGAFGRLIAGRERVTEGRTGVRHR